ncbi:MAG TPA: DNA-3-methyladenine glycosylase I, partial [Actinotalea sp.]|nr:DNA-3-methyladenine glycosylase I [Actinotalea sp.]
LKEMIPDGFTAASEYAVEYTYEDGVVHRCRSTPANNWFGGGEDPQGQQHGVKFTGADGGIFLTRGKIEATVANARPLPPLRAGGGSLTALVWAHAPPQKVRVPRAATFAELPAQTPESVALARSLRAAGFRFVGPTTAYATMQACGLVDDHLAGCLLVG